MDQYYMQQIFSTIFYLSNKIQMQGDKLDEKLTIRQWMILLAILHLPENGASYNKIADKMGCSKQNVKQIILNLEKKHYVTLEKNENDKRALNVRISKNCREIMNNYYDNGNEFLKKMFDDFDGGELEALWKLLRKLASYDGENWTGYEENDVISRK